MQHRGRRAWRRQWPPGGSQGPVVDMSVGGADEAFEQGMGLVGFAAELGMELGGDEERVVGQFDDLDEFAVGGGAAEDEIGLFELVAVGVVELVAVAVPFIDDEGAVEFGGEGAHGELAGVGAQAHGAALAGEFFLFVEQADDGVGRVGFELGGVGLVEFEDVAGEFDGGDLHAQAQAQVGHLVFTGVAGGGDLAFDAPFAEAAGDEDAAQALEHLFGAFAFDVLGIHLDDFDAAIIGHAAVDDGFVDGLVGVLQLDVFADDADADAVLGGDEFADDFLPVGHAGRGGLG